MWDLILPIVEFFASLWRADDRPEARRFLLGCLLVLVLVIVAVGVIIFRFW